MLHKSIRLSLLLTSFACAAAAQGIITTVAGTDWVFPGNHRPALNAPLSTVLGGITVDPAGNPVFSDWGNCMVARINPDGTLEVVAGNGVCASNIEASGDGGAASSAAMYLPSNVAFDGLGNLYVAGVGQVRKVAGGTITSIAGGPNRDGFSGDGGPATQATLSAYLGSIVVDPSGNVYVADTNNNRIRRITPGGIISTVAGNGAAGFSGDNGPATSASLNNPLGLALDSAGNLYIADTFNKRVRKISGGNISTVVSGVTVFSIAFDSGGAMYLGGYNAVYKVAAGSSTPAPIAGSANGTAGYSGDNGPAAAALFNGFNGQIMAAVDNRGNIYIADTGNGRVRKIAASGTITTIGGNGQFRYGGEGVKAVSATLNSPFGLALDESGNKYVSEVSGNRVRKISAGGVMTTFAGAGSPGFSGDNGPATQATLHSPSGLLFNGGNLYIADSSNNVIRKVSSGGVITTVAKVFNPAGLAMDAAGNLYASTLDSRIMRIDSKGATTVFAGTGPAGSSGDGGPATSALLNHPAGLAFDASGNLYVADYLDNRVCKITTQGIISTYAGNGTFGSTGEGGQARGRHRWAAPKRWRSMRGATSTSRKPTSTW